MTRKTSRTNAGSKEEQPPAAQEVKAPAPRRRKSKWLSAEWLALLVAIASLLVAIYSIVEARRANRFAQEANQLAREANTLQLRTLKSEVLVVDYSYSMTVQPQGCLTGEIEHPIGIVHASFFNARLQNASLRDTELRGFFLKDTEMKSDLNWELYPLLGGQVQSLPVTLGPEYNQTWWLIALSQQKFKNQEEALSDTNISTRQVEVVLNLDYGPLAFPIIMWYSISPNGLFFDKTCDFIRQSWIEYYAYELSVDIYDR